MNVHSLTLQNVARALGGDVVGGQVQAPGPNHSDKDRSLSVKLDRDAPDGFIVNSFAGNDPLDCKDYVRSKLGLAAFEPVTKVDDILERMANRVAAGKARVVAEYVYHDANGHPSRKVVRTSAKEFPQYRWDGTGWQAGVKGVPVYPYRLRDMLKAVHNGVFVCEGEKDADRLASLGFVATTNPGGAGSWKADLNQWFEGKDVAILEDNDDAGRKRSQDVARHLHGIADSPTTTAALTCSRGSSFPRAALPTRAKPIACHMMFGRGMD